MGTFLLAFFFTSGTLCLAFFLNTFYGRENDVLLPLSKLKEFSLSRIILCSFLVFFFYVLFASRLPFSLFWIYFVNDLILYAFSPNIRKTIYFLFCKLNIFFKSESIITAFPQYNQFGCHLWTLFCQVHYAFTLKSLKCPLGFLKEAGDKWKISPNS